MIPLSSLPGYVEAAPKKMTIKIASARPLGKTTQMMNALANEVIDLHASLQVVIDVEAMIKIMDATELEGPVCNETKLLAQSLANSAEKFLRIRSDHERK